MIINKEQLKNFIISEVKKIISKNNNISPEKNIQEEVVDINSQNISEIFEDVNSEQNTTNVDDTALEVKKLAEEFKRMKQLVDFRSPLLIKD